MPSIDASPCQNGSLSSADQVHMVLSSIRDHRQLAERTFRLRLECPTIAQQIRPGQFVMVRIPECDDPLLGRPLAMYNTGPDSGGTVTSLDIVYLVVGKMTRRLATRRIGDPLAIWGPLGNGFSSIDCEHLLLVAGGIGQTPLLALALERLGHRTYGTPSPSRPRIHRLTLCYGVRSAKYLACVDDFEAAGVDVRICTEDGSHGQRGLVTDRLEAMLAESITGRAIVACGPEPMLKAVAEIAAAHQVPCTVSLETPMACGVGLCFSCVAKIRQPNGAWDYQRACVQGPIFDATKIVW